MSEEEMREELAAAQAELERLQVAAADREARAAHLQEELSQLRRELAEARSQAEAREQDAASLREASEGLRTQVRGAAERYRELALRDSPELPAELVAGETVEEVEQALERARETVARVRGHMESQAQAGRVPVGAPPRSAPDLSALTPEEKIRQGLNAGR